jgi:hypothetical protein
LDAGKGARLRRTSIAPARGVRSRHVARPPFQNLVVRTVGTNDEHGT